MKVMEQACEWEAGQFDDEHSWTVFFEPGELAEIDAALRHALSISSDVLDIERDDFPLPGLSDKLAAVEHELMFGRGFVKLRGIDRSAYSQHEMEMIYWGIGLHLGDPWPQNKYGHLLGDVTDQGVDPNDQNTRGYQVGGAALPFHCDACDVVGLLCLENGLSGGLSTIANSVTIHNRMVRETPELAAELYAHLPSDFRGEQPPGKPGWYLEPVFTELGDRLFVRCVPPYIKSSQRHEDAPRLTEQTRRALNRLIELANEPSNHISMALQPGDMQFINNHHVLHGRTAYEDGGIGSKRHLKRLWLETHVVMERPTYFQKKDSSKTYWGRNRTASRLEVNR